MLPYLHEKGDSGRRYLVETMGAGLALFDFDDDGDLDGFLVNGVPLPGCDRPARGGWLLRNDGTGRFQDVTSGSGLDDPFYGMGCAVGDIDADGDLDLLVTGFQDDRLFVNDGGRFRDATATAGLAEGPSGWSASAAFADLDGDGDLDLFVTRYLDFTLDTHRKCTLGRDIPTYCSPDAYAGVRDIAFRNDGKGAFVEVTEAWGLHVVAGKGLGVLCGDFDRDGRMDIYVANDGVANTLWQGRAGGGFQDVTLPAGVGFSEDGLAQAGMGVTGGDFFEDGGTCLFVTNLSGETNVLYRPLAQGHYADATVAAGLAAPSLLWTGFGTVAGDLDEDGDLDLFVANGHIIDNIREFHDYASYEQPDHIYRNDGGIFTEVSHDWLGSQELAGAGRGAALGDVDGDGDLDIIVTNCGGPPFLYRNLLRDGAGEAARAGWLLLDLRGHASPPRGEGATVIARAGSRRIVRERFGGGSYLSASDERLHLALPGVDRFDSIEIHWPAGTRQILERVAAGQVLRVHEPRPPATRPAISPVPGETGAPTPSVPGTGSPVRGAGSPGGASAGTSDSVTPSTPMTPERPAPSARRSP